MADQPKLDRSLGLIDVLMFGIGGIVGAGIYAIIGEAAGLAGEMLWLSFTVAATVALLTGLAYAEFVSRFPDAGGSFEYIKRGFGSRAALWMSILMLLTNIIAPAAIAISFSQYLSRLLEVPSLLSTVSIIVLMGGVNMIGMREASWFNTGATIVTLLGLGVVVTFAMPHWSAQRVMGWPDQGINGILAGSALIFFSYVGFEDLVKTAEETKQPKRTMPRAIIASGLIVLVIYVLIAISAVSVMSPTDLASSAGPLAAVLGSVAGQAWVTGLIVVALFATSKTVLSNIMGSSRLLFDVARDSQMHWLARLTHIHAYTQTPLYAIGVITLAVIGFSLIGNLRIVASLSNIFVLLLFVSVNAALIHYRRNHPDDQDAPFRIGWNVKNVPIPTILAIAGLLTLLGYNIGNLI